MTRAAPLYDSQRVTDLAARILRHKRLYYAGRPEISDAAYDRLEDELRALAPRHPALEYVGTEPDDAVERKVPHDEPMLSLQKTYAPEELLRWAGTEPVVGTYKVDGVSLSLVYEGGALVLAKTRGNGVVGEDVTVKARWVADALPLIDAPGRIEVRGEMYCVEPRFLQLSDRMAELGLDRPTSPRNIVAGLLGRKSHVELASHFNFFAFTVVEADTRLGLPTEMEQFAWLRRQGFRLPEPRLLVTPAEVGTYLEHVREEMANGDVPIDGAVFSYNRLTLHRELGNTSHHPRAKMSFKWQGETAESRIESIAWATSRLGVVTPVAVIEPVFLSGARITNVTLHNAAHVRSFNLKAGDRIEIVRSGEVIPKFLQVIAAAAGDYAWPGACPSCGGPLSFDEVRLRCLNAAGCPAQQAGAVLNWIRSAGIDDLSEMRLAPLMDAGLVRTPADLYRLKAEDFLIIPQTRDKMAAKLHQNIEGSRQLPLAAFLNGLGIEGMGLTSWEKLLTAFPSLEAVRGATAERILEVEGFAEKTAAQVVEGLARRSALIDDLLAAGVRPEPPRPVAEGGPLSGRTLVITGALSLPRSEVEKAIKAAGGHLGSSVSKQTYAVVTDDPNSDSSKMKKARQLGVLTWSEQDLWAAIGRPPV